MVSLTDELAGPAATDDVSLWWVGQAGVIVRGPSGTVVIDPFLTDFGGYGRTYDPPVSPGELHTVDLLLGTHDHADHIDPLGFAEIMRASPSAIGVVPAPALERVSDLGVDATRLHGALAGSTLEHGGIRITSFAAVHAPEPSDGYGFHLDPEGRYPFLGFLLELDGVRVCHLGDTLVYDGLGELVASFEPDVLLVPINGRSWFREQRGLVGNMNAFEAAELAEMIGARLTVPIHWDLFADNTEDPLHFVRYAAARHPTVNVLVPERGARVSLRR